MILALFPLNLLSCVINLSLYHNYAEKASQSKFITEGSEWYSGSFNSLVIREICAILCVEEKCLSLLRTIPGFVIFLCIHTDLEQLTSSNSISEDLFEPRVGNEYDPWYIKRSVVSLWLAFLQDPKYDKTAKHQFLLILCSGE